MFKKDLQIEKYLLSLDNNLKYNLAKFRTRTHHLPVTKSRFNKDDPVNVSYSLRESGKIGHEYHYLFTCEFFWNNHAKFIPKCLMKAQIVWKEFLLAKKTMETKYVLLKS